MTTVKLDGNMPGSFLLSEGPADQVRLSVRDTRKLKSLLNYKAHMRHWFEVRCSGMCLHSSPGWSSVIATGPHKLLFSHGTAELPLLQ